MLIKKLLPALCFTACYLLAACDNNKPAATATTAAVAPDSVVKQKDTINREHVTFLEDPFRDINRFDIAVGNNFIDSVYQAYLTGTDTTGYYDLCLGDACSSYIELTNQSEQTRLYMVRKNSSEYGFSNNQFFLKNGLLYFTRTFNVNIEKYATANTGIEWRIEETVHWFKEDSAVCYVKTAFTDNLEGFDFTLPKTTAALTPFNAKDAYKKDADELHEVEVLKYRVATD